MYKGWDWIEEVEWLDELRGGDRLQGGSQQARNVEGGKILGRRRNLASCWRVGVERGGGSRREVKRVADGWGRRSS